MQRHVHWRDPPQDAGKRFDQRSNLRRVHREETLRHISSAIIRSRHLIDLRIPALRELNLSQELTVLIKPGNTGRICPGRNTHFFQMIDNRAVYESTTGSSERHPGKLPILLSPPNFEIASCDRSFGIWLGVQKSSSLGQRRQAFRNS